MLVVTCISFMFNFSQHPSISSASLQAFCYTGSEEQQLNDLREILHSTSPYPDKSPPKLSPKATRRSQKPVDDEFTVYNANSL